MNADAFLDTNVFVYAFDKSAPTKAAQAKALIGSVGWVISWQVVQEFSNVALHRFAVPLKSQDLADYINLVLWPRCTVLPSATLYEMALRTRDRTQYRYYDSLIVSAALASGAKTLYSEDLQHSRALGGLTIINPFIA
jgi:predicted nucleic acid-binding protein